MKKKWKSWLLLAAPYLLCALFPIISVLFLEKTVLTNYQEKMLAEQQSGLQIAFTCVADGALISPMHVVDICTIFGNALENAVECEATVQDRSRRWIHMLVTEKKGFVYAEISNYCEGSVEMRDGLPQSAKKDRRMHGYGVRSIRYAVQKYSGTVAYEQEDEQFFVKILIPKPVTQNKQQHKLQ